MTKRLLTTALLFVFAMLRTALTTAADIRPPEYFWEVIIEGNIEPGDFDKFVRIIKEYQGKITGIYIFSLGGDFFEAMRIGRALRALELSSQVPARSQSGQPSCEDILGIKVPKPNNPNNCTCTSACFFIHVGAVHRSGTYLAVHRPYFAKGEFGYLSQADAQKAFDALQESARTYMQEMGVPAHIQEDVFGTPSERALVLDEKSVITYFWDDLPYRHEWKRNRCSKLSVAEQQRAKDYSRRVLRTRSTSDADLSEAEWSGLLAIEKKRSEEGLCALNIGEQSRIDAYTRYFGVKPTDYAGHDFSKWSDAAKYLGRRFYEIQSEERFDESTLAGLSYLERGNTANAPFISLSDSRTSRKVVTRVFISSAPYPSPEYTRRVIQSLENAWGKRSGGNGTTQWLWDKKEFSAKLSYDPQAFLHLVIY